MANLDTPHQNDYDIIMVGAGIVGCAVAKGFGTDGRRVLLIERDLSEPDRIVGELLQPGGMDALRELGMEGTASTTLTVSHATATVSSSTANRSTFPTPRTVRARRPLAFHFTMVGSSRTYAGLLALHQSTLLSVPACRLFHSPETPPDPHHNHPFLPSPSVTVVEGTANSLIRDADEHKVIGVSYLPKGEKEEFRVHAPLTIVADGLFSKFRKEFTDKTPDVKSNFVGLLAPLSQPWSCRPGQARPHPALPNWYARHARAGRCAWEAAKCVVGRTEGSVVASELPETIRNKFLEALETERLRSMPNGFLPPSSNQTDGLIVMGDAANIRHPLTGGGMTVAFKDVCLLRDVLSPANVPDFRDTDLVLAQLSSYFWRRKGYSAAINVLAMALYQLFAAADDPNLQILQEACFRYFQLGGECIDGPVGLLSGLIQRPIVLVYHFFRVAFYAVYRMFANGEWSDVPGVYGDWGGMRGYPAAAVVRGAVVRWRYTRS
ncbi:squalene epoxidase-domain-containing protein [Endogone sp. FLAS-F59071]|nr:squalene epoxidase-domain-containing protein [Endogone sp. FLAS-F59071]|eukprot:RUS18236.1 squalene epoxidase-domain-containing protein [Endogone sp. FLAS-F59071]